MINMKKVKQSKQGGRRDGSGAKKKYNEPTRTIAFRCPTSRVDEMKTLVKFKLSEWLVR